MFATMSIRAKFSVRKGRRKGLSVHIMELIRDPKLLD